ncbi:MAG: PQQ-binding-like beta-propeller repeat protein [Spirosomataceae bacterium]
MKKIIVYSLLIAFFMACSKKSEPLPKGIDAVFVGSSDNKFYALNAKTGAALWSFATSGAVHSSPTLAIGLVIVGSSDEKIYALDIKTGTKVWEFSLEMGISSAPFVANGIVYVGMGNKANFTSKLIALDVVTGIKKWEFIAEGQ